MIASRYMRSSTVLVAVVCLLALPANAWNDLGHEAVAYIAWQRLDPAVRAEVSRLIRLNPSYNDFVAGIPDDADHQAERDLRAFMKAATWPDMIKGDHNMISDGPENGNRAPDSPDSVQNIGYSDRNLHKYWHFKDVPFTMDGTALKQPQEANAETRIVVFRQVLESKKPAGMSDTDFDRLRSYDLVWLMHLVGDVHQPLHCVSRYTSTQPDGDAGGNTVRVSAGEWNGRLHGFWDDALGRSKDPADAATAAKALSPADAARSAIVDPAEWMMEGVKLCKTVVYAAPIGDGGGPYALDDGYIKNAKAAAAGQVAVAGARLGSILNHCFGH